MNPIQKLNWRVAAASGAVVGVGLGGFVVATGTDSGEAPDRIELRPADSRTASASIHSLSSPVRLAPSTTVAGETDSAGIGSLGSQVSPPSPRSIDSPASSSPPGSAVSDRPTSNATQPPVVLADDSPDSPPSPDSPDSPPSPESPDSPPSPPSPDSPDSPPSPPSIGSAGSS